MSKTIVRSAAFAFALLLAGAAGGDERSAADAHKESLLEASRWIESNFVIRTQHNYVVTAGVRFLLFWVSRDDVGQGYIRMGHDSQDPELETIQLLMGSDPAKAPLAINRWGAATEVVRGSEGAFFGFMKSSKGKSAAAMKGEVEQEKSGGRFEFDGIISRVEEKRSISTTVPITASDDFTLHQLPEAQRMIMENLNRGSRTPRLLDGSDFGKCPGPRGFLFTVRDLIEASLAGGKPPISRCYVYNSRLYTLTLKSLEEIAGKKVGIRLHGTSKKIERTYENLREVEFRAVNEETKEQSKFRIVYGLSGGLRGVPVQIEYQPNWWFKAVLNLDPSGSPADKGGQTEASVMQSVSWAKKGGDKPA